MLGTGDAEWAVDLLFFLITRDSYVNIVQSSRKPVSFSRRLHVVWPVCPCMPMLVHVLWFCPSLPHSFTLLPFSSWKMVEVNMGIDRPCSPLFTLIPRLMRYPGYREYRCICREIYKHREMLSTFRIDWGGIICYNCILDVLPMLGN